MAPPKIRVPVPVFVSEPPNPPMTPFQVVVTPGSIKNVAPADSVVPLVEVKEAVVSNVPAPMKTKPAAAPKFASALMVRVPALMPVPMPYVLAPPKIRVPVPVFVREPPAPPMAPFQVVVTDGSVKNVAAPVSVVPLVDVKEAVVSKVAAPMETVPAEFPKFASALMERSPALIVVPVS